MEPFLQPLKNILIGDINKQGYFQQNLLYTLSILLKYCISSRGGAAKSHMIERAQRLILKVIFCKPRMLSTTKLQMC